LKYTTLGYSSLHYCLFKVNDWLERLVDEKGEDLYRLKGVISVNESTGRFVFQVADLFFSIYLNEFEKIHLLILVLFWVMPLVFLLAQKISFLIALLRNL